MEWGLIFFFDNHEHVLVFLLHQELLAGEFLQVLLVGGEFVQPGGVLFYLFQVIFPVSLQPMNLGRHPEAVHHIILIKKEHPYDKHRNGEHILVLQPGPYLQPELLHASKLSKKETGSPFTGKRLSTPF